jgi:threonine dehydrogenase-like Zn-dependent dehydrogenase
MPKGLFVDQPEHVTLREYDDAPLAANEVRFRSEFAAIKHGTLFHIFSGKSPFETGYFDGESRLFKQKEASSGPGGLVGQFLGDTTVGIVTEVGSAVEQFRVGDRVYAYAPIQETITRPVERVKPLPAGLSPADAVCVDPAFFAYAMMRDSHARLGDDVVLFGLGAIGLFLVQMLKISGCLSVIVVDPMPKRRALAERFGATLTLDPTAVDVAVAVREVLGRGADLAIESSGSYRALAEAMRAVGMCGKIATLGYYKGNPAALDLSAEWHHNRLELIGSMPVWGNPSREYPLWDEARLFCTVEALFAKGAITSEGITDPIVSLGDVAEAFLSIYHHPDEAIKLSVAF